ncbi:Stk1 family PASTA domain-containing Ser/Thr kinase [Spiractinospora alimapuensis]|uniref:Stk1 family PASTA domain-containing Ser/Thr kinase n=1 Tax=Spiractinospora alimapuensis TaxID=2820884 RepID=UPI001F45A0E0|nr:Stk1 family PASTA domain-containing Ser/Thr kinase [Spiractinospora alimapuensis]QVQ50455.1 Stk1 family PASTA domain-containing Ser/Thr kinase [Spiractinospora alimapuensis]
MSQPRLLGGRYQLEGVVGQGGMAEVYRGRDIRLDRVVAVKTLRHDMARDQTFQARFRREAQSAASLNHASIVAVYDTGEDTLDGVSIPFIVMEYVDGRTVKELIDDGRRLLPERAMEITEGVLRALEYSHRNGIVHRDIKPANVMLTKQAEVKVMDFGIARSTDESQVTMTQTAQVIGTAQYLSPEQARGERVDSRSDIYSTGCLLYELLTGQPPFTGDTPVSIAYQHVREDPVPPTHLDPEVPQWMEAIVLRAMAKDPGQRYQTAEDMRNDIQRGLSGMPTSAAMAPAGGTTMLPPVQDDDEYDDRKGGGGKKALWVLLVLAVLAALIFLGWLFLRNGVNDVSVPDVEGMEQSAAEQHLSDAGLTNVVVEEQADSEIDEGDAIGTEPQAGASVAEDSEVTLLVSTGADEVDVPDVVGLTESEAQQELQDADLEVGQTTTEPTQDAEPGEVMRTTPAAGDTVETGSTVDLVIADEPDDVEVPDVMGLSEQEAINALSNVALEGSTQTEVDNDADEGSVVRQNPEPGSALPPGSTVTITIAEHNEDDDDDDDDNNGNNGNGNGNDPSIPWPPGDDEDFPWPRGRGGDND